MPRENGRLYAQMTGGERAGLTLNEIASTLGVSSLSLGTLCRSPRINGLSRYRPVRWNRPALTVSPVLTQHHNSMYWNESGDAVRWWQGEGYEDGYRTIVAPELDMPFDDLVDIDGNFNEAAKWRYNLPPEGEFVHQAHFHGYNHKARPSVFGYVSGGTADGRLSERLGTIRLGINANPSAYNSYYALMKEDGCWAPNELLNIIGFPQKAYIGVAVRNRNVTGQSDGYSRFRYTIGTAAEIHFDKAGGTPRVNVMGNYRSGEFETQLKMANSTDDFYAYGGSYGGIGQQIRSGDVIDVLVFLSKEPVESDASMEPVRIKGRSLYINDDYRPYRTFRVVSSTAVTQYNSIDYKYWLSSPVDTGGEWFFFDDYLYFRAGDYVYAFDGVMANLKFQGSDQSVINVRSDSAVTTEVSVYAYYDLDGAPPFSFRCGTETMTGGSIRTGWVSPYIKVTDDISIAADPFSYEHDLVYYLQKKLGMSSTEIQRAGVMLPQVPGEVYRMDGSRLVPIEGPWGVNGVSLRVECSPRANNVEEEFVSIRYTGRSDYDRERDPLYNDFIA